MSSVRASSATSSPSLMSLNSSRASSPFDLTVTGLSVDQTKELEVERGLHSQYYFKDGNLIFLVEDTLYNVHRYFFARDSMHFRAILQGLANTEPCVLPGVSCADFDEFLAILYPTDFRRPTKKTTSQWTSIIHLSAKWDFESIKLLAIDNLTTSADPVDKIVLGRRYGITEWLAGAYEAVCTRADPLSMEEGLKLGVEDTVRISAARQLYGTGMARFEGKHLSGDLGQIFKLGPLSGGVSSLDDEEYAIKVLGEQVAEAWTEHLADPCPVGDCTFAPWHYVDKSGALHCGCRSESDVQKVRREAKEEMEQQLGELESRLEQMRPELVGRQERMASFK